MAKSTRQNIHDWTGFFNGDVCAVCQCAIASGTGKANHAKKHERENKAWRIGHGTAAEPFKFLVI